MALPRFNDPNLFVDYVNPAGQTWQIPASIAPTFNLPPPPPAPPPTDPVTPVPSVTAPPPVPTAVPVAPPANANIPPPAPAPTPSKAPAVETSPVDPGPSPAGPVDFSKSKTDPTGAQMDALENMANIAQRQGELDSRAAREAVAIRERALQADDLAEKQRAAVRDQELKEEEFARANQQSAMDAFVNHKVDQGRMWHSMSTSSKVMAGIAAALGAIGGAMRARDTGGPVQNPALDILTKAIDDDVRIQFAERDKLGQVAQMRRDAINDLRVQFKDREAAYDAVRAGRREQVARQIEVAAAKIQDPAKKLEAERNVEMLRMQGAQIGEQAQQREIENRRANKQLAIAGGNLALNQAQFSRGIFESDRNFAEGQRRFDLEQNAAYLAALTKAQEARAKGNKDAEEAARKEAAEIRDLSIGGGVKTAVVKDGKATVAYEPLKNSKGEVWKAPAQLAPKLQVKKGKVDNLVKLMDDTMNLMEQHGYEPDFLKTEAGQQLKSNWASMALNEKTIAELGVLAGPDMGLIAQRLGTDDPTAWIDSSAGIRKARQNTLGLFNDELRGAGYDGPDYDIKEQTRRGIQEQTKNTAAGNALAASQRRVRTGEDTSLYTQKKALERMAKGESPAEPLHPTALAGIAGAAALAKQGDPRGLDVLTQIGNSDPRPEARKAAREYAAKAGLKIEWKK